jgi:flagellar biosynthetic protein FliP
VTCPAAQKRDPGVRGAAGVIALAAALLLLTASLAAAQNAGEAQTTGAILAPLAELIGGAPSGSAEGAALSGRIIQIIGLLTVLSVAPGLLIMMTCFTRFVIVFAMLRSALGLNQTPPNMVLVSMAMFMTFFVMQPVFEQSWEEGVRPLIENRITEEEAIVKIGAPVKAFLFENTRPKDLELFHNISARSGGDEARPLAETAEAAEWRSLIPAFMISELRRAFIIGFLIYLPFLAIDLIVASVLMSAGMMMLPPVIISLPFKVIFFVLIDGWHMLAGSLVESYLGS